jgi:hypothetical protein
MPFFVAVKFQRLLKHASCFCCDVGWLEGFLSIWCERSMVAQTWDMACDVHDFLRLRRWRSVILK